MPKNKYINRSNKFRILTIRILRIGFHKISKSYIFVILSFVNDTLCSFSYYYRLLLDS